MHRDTPPPPIETLAPEVVTADDAPSPAGGLTVVAAFDVDGTLTVRDCVVPFLRRVIGAPRLTLRLAGRPHRLVPPLLRRDRDELKVLAAAAAFRGRSADEIGAMGAHFGAQVARSGLRGDTTARLRWHREQGHRVVLVSASFEVYLAELGRHLGVDGVLGTRLEVGPDGRLTGALVGRNCRGPEKVERLHGWLAEQHGGRRHVRLWAYGDSTGDRELLADADHPVWVRDVVTTVAPTEW